MNRLVYITGSRAEYGLMQLTLKRLDKEFDLQLIVTGMHLSSLFGKTINEIKKDKFKIAAEIDILTDDTGKGMALALGKGIIGMAKIFNKIKPEMVLVFGDRAEPLAGAIAGAYLNIPVAHIHGGDQGDAGVHIDDMVRHAITKFSHLHLPATEKSAERIKKMGEEAWRIHIVGSPGIEAILKEKFLSKTQLQKKYHLNFHQPLLLVVQHPVLTQAGQAASQIKETLAALAQLRWQTVLIYPNADAGGQAMIKVVQQYKNQPWLQTYKSLPRKDYLSLMKQALAIVGNSSSATIEAPALKIPAVNIGARESEREGGNNKLYVGYRKEQIVNAIKKIKNNKQLRLKLINALHPYTEPQTSVKITQTIKKFINQKDKLLRKQLTI